MSTTTEQAVYRRVHGVTWRDTGRHVVLQKENGEVLVLGGGGAMVWRLLTEPRDVAGLLDAVAAGGVRPTGDELSACLDDLVERSLLHSIGDETC